jgi:uncharacterized membrane protein
MSRSIDRLKSKGVWSLPPRLLSWLLAAGFILAVVMALPIDDDARGLAFILALAAGFLLLIAVELFRARLRHADAEFVAALEDPADGVVEIRRLPAARTVPNEVNPVWARFEASSDGAEDTIARPWPATNGLRGRWILVSIFVGKYGTDWQGEEIDRVLKALERAARWVEREAKRFHAPVNLEICATYIEARDEIEESVAIGFQPEGRGHGPFAPESPGFALASASRAVAKAGFDDLIHCLSCFRDRLNPSSVVPFIHLRQAGRSHATVARELPVPPPGIAVCYADYADFPEPLERGVQADALTYAHEMLHLFGASDKYGFGARAFDRSQVSERDVMLLAENQLVRTRIDPMTAGEIGWA